MAVSGRAEATMVIRATVRAGEWRVDVPSATESGGTLAVSGRAGDAML